MIDDHRFDVAWQQLVQNDQIHTLLSSFIQGRDRFSHEMTQAAMTQLMELIQQTQQQSVAASVPSNSHVHQDGQISSISPPFPRSTSISSSQYSHGSLFFLTPRSVLIDMNLAQLDVETTGVHFETGTETEVEETQLDSDYDENDDNNAFTDSNDAARVQMNEFIAQNNIFDFVNQLQLNNSQFSKHS